MSFSRSSQFSVNRLGDAFEQKCSNEVTTCQGYKKGFLGWNCKFGDVSPLFQFGESKCGSAMHCSAVGLNE